MITFEARLKRWGDSLGVVIPKEKADEEHLKVNKKVRIMILTKTPKVKDIFGKLKNWKKPIEQIMREIDEELYRKE